MLPETECSNPLTANIDQCGDIATLLHSVDQQLLDSLRLQSPRLDAELDALAVVLAEAVTTGGVVVVSGCGTSGRLAAVTCALVNRRLPAPAFRPCLAGGRPAFAASVESVEDSASEGVAALTRLLGNGGAGRNVLIGVSCGLSAPFVLAQVELCLDRPGLAFPALLGFNSSAACVRDDPQPGLGAGSCRALVQRLRDAGAGLGLLVNPAIGPEAIAGSSRMKGGTATLILLFIAAGRMLARLGLLDAGDGDWLSLSGHLDRLDRLLESVYQCGDTLNDWMQQFADSVCRLGGGGVVYAFGEPVCSAMAAIDASECAPTFGAAPDDVRAIGSAADEFLSVISSPVARDVVDSKAVTRDADNSMAAGAMDAHDSKSAATDADNSMAAGAIDAHDSKSAATDAGDRDTVDNNAAVAKDAWDFMATVAKDANDCNAAVAKDANDCNVAVAKDANDSKVAVANDNSGIVVGFIVASPDLSLEQPTRCRRSLGFRLPGNTDVAADLMLDLNWLPATTSSFWRDYAVAMATKLALNRLSTAGYVLAGRTYGNLMVDMVPANSKLAERAARIVAEVAGGGCSQADARAALRRAMEEEAPGDRVVAVAVLLARQPGLSPGEARALLAESGGRLRPLIG